jgi:predicted nuclease of predicted toxin-antitoxin system
MKILIDECLPVKIKRGFPEHDVLTVAEKAWNGTKNGELQSLAAKEFDVFITVDQNLPYQQNISGYDVVVIALRAKSNSLQDLEPLVPCIKELMVDVTKGQVYRIGL